MDALDSDAVRPAAVHRQHRRLDDRGARQAALADLWSHAHRARRFTARRSGKCLDHFDRYHGPVHRDRDYMAVSYLTRNRDRAEAYQWLQPTARRAPSTRFERAT